MSLNTTVLPAASQTQTITPHPPIIAHRGVPGAARENTLASFEEAWRQEADGVETDIHLTRDQRIVCHHDSGIPRAFWGKLAIAKSSYKTARRAFGKGRRPGEHLPLLNEVLEALPPGKSLYIEIKCGLEIVPVLKTVLEESPVSLEQVTVICFNPGVIGAWKEAMPNVKALWLSSYLREEYPPYQACTPPALVKKVRTAGADGVSIESQESLDKTLTQYLRKQGMEVHVWTVDSTHQAIWYRDLGLDSITTNRPGEIRRYFSRAKAPHQ
ncbi:MAG: hypothetical protein JEZ02_20000 [Desulfatibacillum sp.]|nr:hypothetical protein [Desulfatibacillum sp.]